MSYLNSDAASGDVHNGPTCRARLPQNGTGCGGRSRIPCDGGREDIHLDVRSSILGQIEGPTLQDRRLLEFPASHCREGWGGESPLRGLGFLAAVPTLGTSAVLFL